jgi:APA family basic amino acid/polyamine antiporter
MVVGIILGASIFVQPSEITRLVTNTRGLLGVWAAAGALTLCGALICAELSTVFPETGGVYIFLKEIFSPSLGFLWGWGMFWSMHSGIIAAIAVILVRYVGFFVPMGAAASRITAAGVIAALSVINYLGVKAGSAVQVTLTAIKVVAVAAMVVLLFEFGGAAHRAIPAEFGTVAAIPFRDYALAVAAGLFAFGGWHMVTYAAGETREPTKTIPRALVMGSLIVTACYVLLNAAYLYVLPLGRVAASSRVAADAMEHAMGLGAGGAIAALVIVSAMGALNGIILAGPRVYYAMAQDGLAFRWLGAVHPERRTPHLAIAAQCVWACVLVGTNSYRQLFSRVVYTEWIFFAMLAAGLFVLKQRGKYRPVFLKGLFPLAPAVFAIAALSVAVIQGSADWRGSAKGMALLLAGVPVYFVWRHSRKIDGVDAERNS